MKESKKPIPKNKVTKKTTTQKKKVEPKKEVTPKKKTQPKKPTIKRELEKVKEIELVEEVVVEEKSKLINFLNNQNYLLIFSLFIGLIAILLALKFSSAARIYTFGGFNEVLTVDSGMIATTSKFAAFEGNNFTYKGEDINVSKYKIGYFLKSNDFITEVAAISGTSQTPKSLKGLLNSIVGFNFSEPVGSKGITLDKEALQMINDGKLYFIIEYTAANDEYEKPKNIELQLRVSKRM